MFICLKLYLYLVELKSALALDLSLDGLDQMPTEAQDRSVASSVKCKLQGSTRIPAFSMDGDYVIGGVFSIHYYMQTVNHDYTTMPEPVRCSGRSVSKRIGLQNMFGCAGIV